MSKKSKPQDELTVISRTLPEEAAKIANLSRQGNEALAALYGAHDWADADCARKLVQKSIKALESVATQMATVNIALAEIATRMNTEFQETANCYEDMLSDRQKELDKSYDRGKRDGLKQGEVNGYRASQADYQAEAARLRAMFQ